MKGIYILFFIVIVAVYISPARSQSRRSQWLPRASTKKGSRPRGAPPITQFSYSANRGSNTRTITKTGSRPNWSSNYANTGLQNNGRPRQSIPKPPPSPQNNNAYQWGRSVSYNPMPDMYFNPAKHPPVLTRNNGPSGGGRNAPRSRRLKSKPAKKKTPTTTPAEVQPTQPPVVTTPTTTPATPKTPAPTPVPKRTVPSTVAPAKTKATQQPSVAPTQSVKTTQNTANYGPPSGQNTVFKQTAPQTASHTQHTKRLPAAAAASPKKSIPPPPPPVTDYKIQTETGSKKSSTKQTTYQIFSSWVDAPVAKVSSSGNNAVQASGAGSIATARNAAKASAAKTTSSSASIPTAASALAAAEGLAGNVDTVSTNGQIFKSKDSSNKWQAMAQVFTGSSFSSNNVQASKSSNSKDNTNNNKVIQRFSSLSNPTQLPSNNRQRSSYQPVDGNNRVRSLNSINGQKQNQKLNFERQQTNKKKTFSPWNVVIDSPQSNAGNPNQDSAGQRNRMGTNIGTGSQSGNSLETKGSGHTNNDIKNYIQSLALNKKQQFPWNKDRNSQNSYSGQNSQPGNNGAAPNNLGGQKGVSNRANNGGASSNGDTGGRSGYNMDGQGSGQHTSNNNNVKFNQGQEMRGQQYTGNQDRTSQNTYSEQGSQPGNNGAAPSNLGGQQAISNLANNGGAFSNGESGSQPGFSINSQGSGQDSNNNNINYNQGQAVNGGQQTNTKEFANSWNVVVESAQNTAGNSKYGAGRQPDNGMGGQGNGPDQASTTINNNAVNGGQQTNTKEFINSWNAVVESAQNTAGNSKNEAGRLPGNSMGGQGNGPDQASTTNNNNAVNGGQQTNTKEFTNSWSVSVESAQNSAGNSKNGAGRQPDNVMGGQVNGHDQTSTTTNNNNNNNNNNMNNQGQAVNGGQQIITKEFTNAWNFVVESAQNTAGNSKNEAGRLPGNSMGGQGNGPDQASATNNNNAVNGGQQTNTKEFINSWNAVVESAQNTAGNNGNNNNYNQVQAANGGQQTNAEKSVNPWNVVIEPVPNSAGMSNKNSAGQASRMGINKGDVSQSGNGMEAQGSGQTNYNNNDVYNNNNVNNNKQIQSQGQTTESTQSAAPPGESAGPIKTPCSLSPVCGTDGYTYMSTCFIWAGVSKACDGFCPCKNQNPPPTSSHKPPTNNRQESPSDNRQGSPPNNGQGPPPNNGQGSPPNYRQGSPPNNRQEPSPTTRQEPPPNNRQGPLTNKQQEPLPNNLQAPSPNSGQGPSPNSRQGPPPNNQQGPPQNNGQGYPPNNRQGPSPNNGQGYPPNIRQGPPPNNRQVSTPNKGQGPPSNNWKGLAPVSKQGPPPPTFRQGPPPSSMQGPQSFSRQGPPPLAVIQGPPPPNRRRPQTPPRMFPAMEPAIPTPNVPPPCNCPDLHRPVCSVSGNTYENDCLRRCKYDGFKCQGKCPCGKNSIKYQATDFARPDLDPYANPTPLTQTQQQTSTSSQRMNGVQLQQRIQTTSILPNRAQGRMQTTTRGLGPNGRPVQPKPTSLPEMQSTTYGGSQSTSTLAQGHNGVPMQTAQSTGNTKSRTATNSNSNTRPNVVQAWSGRQNSQTSSSGQTNAKTTTAGQTQTNTMSDIRQAPKGPTKAAKGKATKSPKKPKPKPKPTPEVEPIEREPGEGGPNGGSGGVSVGAAPACHCNNIYAPVCGTDGITYTNPCDLTCSSGFGTACNGECPCDPFIIEPVYFCEDYCSTTYQPVCSMWGRTYDNDCMMKCSQEEKDCNGECPCPGAQPPYDPQSTQYNNQAAPYDPQPSQYTYDPAPADPQPSQYAYDPAPTVPQSNQYAEQPALYDPQPTQYNNQPAQYDPPPTQYNNQPAQYDPPPTQYNNQQAQYDPPPTQYNTQPAQYNPPPTQYNNQPAQYDPQPTQYNNQPAPHDPQPTQYNNQPAPYDPQPTQYNNQPAQYDPQPTQYNNHPAPYDPQPTQYNNQPAPYEPQPTHYNNQPAPYDPQPSAHYNTVPNQPAQQRRYSTNPNNYNAEPSNQPVSTCECVRTDVDPVCSTMGETLWYGCDAICRGITIACSSECPC